MNQHHHHREEWIESAIAPSLIELNLKSLEEEDIAEWYFGNLPPSARRNDGRIRDGYLKAYREPLKGGWGIEGYDPTDLSAEPELRSFKPNSPRIGKDGKSIKYDIPKNAKHNPILARVSYEIARLIFRASGLDFHELTRKYAPEELNRDLEDNAECPWFWRAVLEQDRVAISVAEGAKKALSLLGQGRCAIAVTSITTWRAKIGSGEVHPWLALFAPKRLFYLTFDQDIKPKTVRAVNTQSSKLGQALVKAGAVKVKRISWSGTSKGIDDFIYSLKSRFGDRYMQRILRKCYTNARDYRKFALSKQLPGRIKKVNKRYLEVSDIIKAGRYKILVVKSAKGTRKTGVLAELVRIDRANGIPTINLSHLERLARELGMRLNVPYRTEAGTTTLRNSYGYSLCVDSLSPKNSIPFHPEKWRNAGLAIDEFTQVLEHLAFGTTEVKRYRGAIVATLGQKLADCWEQNKPIRLLDADANPESIELIYDLIQLYCDREISREELEANTLTIVNEYEPAKGDLHFYHEPSPKKIRADLVEMMKDDRNLLLLSSSQKATSADGTLALERLARKHYLPSEILRIDSTTVADPTHPAFGITAHLLADIIENTNVKIVIASPIICTGISIEYLNCFFQGVFSFQAGNISPHSVRQQLVRLRDFDAPRYLWCPKTGMNFVGSKSTNSVELLTDQKGEAKLSLSLLGCSAAENLLDSNVCPLTKFWARVGVERNRYSYQYRELLLLDIETEGWNIIHHWDDKDPLLEEVWQERKAIKEEAVVEEDRVILQSQDLTHAEAESLQQRKDLTRQEQYRLHKYQLAQKYFLSEINQKLIAADRKRFYSCLQLRFWLGIGRPFLERRDCVLWQDMFERNGKVFLPDFNQQTYITPVKLLEMLDLQRFARPETQWSNKSPELIDLSNFVKKDLVRFNQILGCGVAIGDSPIVVLQKVQKKLGMRSPYLRNERDGKKRLRIYGAAESRFELDDLEKQISFSWLAYFTRKFVESEAENNFTSGAA